ncbi:D12 class N6 adenine-specific DNA methyltransferase [Xanthomonas translucens pv. poae]|uniref:site-specific DNA-methyltransferase (adenine-specific) n=2 Tax=Xanthomonas translucens group TaxID=3390202 RepID=A0A0K3A1B2_9XANT|nr:D12 class N6 adenine-specific DNA methyltransferase [Xanthomonas translucens pv. poae]
MEPYAGGAGVALELLYDGVVTDVHINDADPAIRDFWLAATRHTPKLIRMVENEDVTIEAWHYWRDVMLGNEKAGLVERGFATLFLNRTNRSGILKGGVIGGKSQSGEYKLDARYKREVLTSRLRLLRKHAKHIHVYGEDALLLLKRSNDILPDRTLIYLDPPYYIKGQGLYRNFYNHDDHVAIAQLLQCGYFKLPWIVSYDDAPQIRAMYAESLGLGYGLKYTAQKRYVGSEVMFFAPGLEAGSSKALAA